MTGDDVASVDGLFSGEEVLLLESPRDFFIPNIDEKALLIVFLVFRASWPKMELKSTLSFIQKDYSFLIHTDYFSIHKSIYLIDLLLKRQEIRCFLFSTVDLDS